MHIAKNRRSQTPHSVRAERPSGIDPYTLLAVIGLVVLVVILAVRAMDRTPPQEADRESEERVSSDEARKSAERAAAMQDRLRWSQAETRRRTRVLNHRTLNPGFQEESPLPDDCAACQGLGLARTAQIRDGKEVLITHDCESCGGTGIKKGK